MSAGLAALVAFALTATSYFYRQRLCAVLCLAAYYAISVFIAAGFLGIGAVLFWLLVVFLVGLPSVCLAIFGLDFAFGIFCIDTTYTVMIAALLGLVLLFFDLLFVVLKML